MLVPNFVASIINFVICHPDDVIPGTLTPFGHKMSNTVVSGILKNILLPIFSLIFQLKFVTLMSSTVNNCLLLSLVNLNT